MSTPSALALAPAPLFRTPQDEAARRRELWATAALGGLVLLALLACPGIAHATNPFSAGTTGAQTWLQSILLPVAIIGVIVVGVLALFGIMRWGMAISAMAGIVVIFGAPQLVAWARQISGV